MTRALLNLAPALMLLSACISNPRTHETEPVEVEAAEGVVTSQLAGECLVAWDQSIDHPATMSVDVADAICKAEGRRQQAAG